MKPKNIQNPNPKTPFSNCFSPEFSLLKTISLRVHPKTLVFTTDFGSYWPQIHQPFSKKPLKRIITTAPTAIIHHYRTPESIHNAFDLIDPPDSNLMVHVLSLTGGALYTTSVLTNMIAINADVPTLARCCTRNCLYAFSQVSFLLLVLCSIGYCSILLLFFIGRSNFSSFLLLHLVGLDITFAPSPIVEPKSQLTSTGDPDLVTTLSR